MLLDLIKHENDIKKIPREALPELAAEIRQFLIEKVSVTGGHLASNLGMIEITLALHYLYHLPEDKIIWDVGHQSYTHKIMTGRKDQFDTLRQYGGLSGFPKRCESECDCFNTGHSSTSLSAGLGFVRAREITGENYEVVSVIGDGSLTGGMAYEALNNASKLKSNFVIVLNDNKMSISENTGGISTVLNNIRTADPYLGLKSGIESRLEKTNFGTKVAGKLKNTKNSIKYLLISGQLFENMGLTYLGPIDGHNVEQLIRVLEQARKLNHGVIVHVLTKKGKGYEPAELFPTKFHGTEAFHIESGENKIKKEKATYTDVFGAAMKKIGERNDKVIAITAAMTDGTGLTRFAKSFPKRFFDVGIAEEHAVTFAAALAVSGLRPVVAVYSSFLQRAFDQALHDVCMQNLPVVFAVDRAGIVGNDGETHQGIFDLSYLSLIPNLTVMAPKNKWELHDMLQYAVCFDGPIAIRFPRGTAFDQLESKRPPIVHGKGEVLYEGGEVALLAVGSMVETALSVRRDLAEQGIACTVINARFVKPFDEALIWKLARDYKLLVTMEENVETGGFGQQINAFLQKNHLHIPQEIIALPDQFVEHGDPKQLKKEFGIDAGAVEARVLMAYRQLGPAEGSER